MQIFRSERFRKEYDSIVSYINECPNDLTKKDLNRLLGELVHNVKKIDQMHQDLTLINRLGEGNNEIRDKIVETRKKIFKIINNSSTTF